ncbi:hypothetical protein L1987_03980 [Smallanthus sonchifolius]|uniref:Uncharacterized protein n=1 Tax=Smallanthus sonchifolius TaxID=185202 RepID=A0ACB9KC41_9ASTR|nr:hypothetical protein L1987_03980 [Smallanthus sonchifolius]
MDAWIALSQTRRHPFPFFFHFLESYRYERADLKQTTVLPSTPPSSRESLCGFFFGMEQPHSSNNLPLNRNRRRFSVTGMSSAAEQAEQLKKGGCKSNSNNDDVELYEFFQVCLMMGF